LGASALFVPEWVNTIHSLFPQEAFSEITGFGEDCDSVSGREGLP
jgi:hypothetical protein